MQRRGEWEFGNPSFCRRPMEEDRKVSNPKKEDLESLQMMTWGADFAGVHPTFPWNYNFYTGGGIIVGCVVGGAKGALEGLKEAGKEEGMKLRRISRVLSSCGSGGMRLGGLMGGLGMMYGLSEWSACHARGGADDSLNSFLAGLATSALYKSSCGPRSAAIAGVLGGLGAASLVAGVKLWLKNRNIRDQL